MELDLTEEEIKLLQRNLLEYCAHLNGEDFDRAHQTEKVVDSLLVKFQDALDKFAERPQ